MTRTSVKIATFRELEVYKAAREAAKEIVEVTKTFPTEEKYALTTQMRNSSRSVCGGIGEAWRRRKYEAAFVSKLNESEGEAEETRVWLDVALDCGYIDDKQHGVLDRRYDRILGQIVNMETHPWQWVFPEKPGRRMKT